MTTKHFQGRLGVRKEATKCNLQPMSLSTVTAASPVHAARNSLMTGTFGKRQIVACQRQIRNKKGGSLAHEFINQQLECLMYIHATYPDDLNPTNIVSTEHSP